MSTARPKRVRLSAPACPSPGRKGSASPPSAGRARQGQARARLIQTIAGQQGRIAVQRAKLDPDWSKIPAPPVRTFIEFSEWCRLSAEHNHAIKQWEKKHRVTIYAWEAAHKRVKLQSTRARLK